MDHNATTALRPGIISAMNEILPLNLNASSIHASGRYARGLVEEARGSVAKAVNAGSARIIFTASGTESNNLALRGQDKFKILVSAIEHASINKTGVYENLVPVNNAGIVDVAGLERLLKTYSGSKFLVSVMLANNETGVIQPVKEIAEIVHGYGGIVHTDAVQAFGKIAVDMEDLGVDMLTISSHKIGGPQGASALIAKKHVPLHAIIYGGGQEQGYRAGTENVAAIYGFGLAAGEVVDSLKKMQKVKELRNDIEKSIKSTSKDALIFGEESARLPNTSMVYMPNVTSETQLIHFDMAGIEVSSGSACSSGKVETSHVLLAMGVRPEIAKCAIRVSLGIDNTKEEATKFINAWKELYERAGARAA